MSCLQQQPLEFAPGHWQTLMQELWRRGDERRESGAFLLASRHSPRRVQQWVMYDELDPSSRRYAYVRLEPIAFTRVFEICGRLQLEILADIHTHPFEPHQSASDCDNPMVAIPGHIALIAPYFARAPVSPADVSVNIYGGDGRWSSFLGREAATLIVAP